MSKSGGGPSAVEFLEPVYRDNPEDAETAGILAGVYKDRFKETASTPYAQKSLETYLKNYLATGSYYTGINAATMHQIIGKGNRAREIASELIAQLDLSGDDIWKQATLGEAYLLTKDYDAAVHHYKRASKIGKGNYGQLNSIYAQLLLLKHYIRIPSEILGFFEPPRIAIFTGHMIDHPDRPSPRFPNSITDEIKSSITNKLDENNIRIGYCSLACGGDILFAEALLEIGGEVNIYLPFAKSDFIETSVGFAGQEWVDRFNRLVESCGVTFITEEKYFGDEDLYHFLGKVLIGSTILRSSIMHTQPLIITVQSEKDMDAKLGGSRSVKSIWPFEENTLINVDPDQYIKTNAGHTDSHAEDNIHEKVEVDTPEEKEIDMAKVETSREIRYILFADIVGYSKIEEEQMPYFMHDLLTRVSTELRDYPKPRIFNTWGDAIFAVFRKAQHAVDYSFKLREVFKSIDWENEKLPSELNVRIALHAGPVFVGNDPLTNKLNAYGAHINRTARMEPVTLPGTIYASQQFAATLAVESFKNYQYHHVGMVKLAKEYGIQEIYMINPMERTAMSG